MKPAISSHSLGRAWVHSFEKKLDAAEQYGLDLELFYEDIEYVAKLLPDGVTHENLIRSAHQVRSMCDQRDINIICLQPFMHYEGLLDRARHAERIVEMKLWLRLVEVLGTTLIGIPSSFLSASETSDDFDLIVSDLQEIADLGLEQGIRFSYEALCWGTHVDTWERSWQIVQAVDRTNFGICLDTFNMAGRFYADPEAESGKTADADVALERCLQGLSKVDVNKIFCVQVVDAQKLAQPITPHHPIYDSEQPARMSWSRNCRLFYGEDTRGAYLPILEILQVLIVDLGYDGPVSAELFNACLTEAASNLPSRLAERASLSWQKMMQDLLEGATSKEEVIATRQDSAVSLRALAGPVIA